MKVFLWSVLGLALLIGLGWVCLENDYLQSKYFAPKQEQVRRDVFEKSKAFNQGMIQDLQTFQLEYVKNAKNADAQKMIANTVTHRYADFDVYQLPPDLRGFVIEMKQVSMEIIK